LQRCCTHGLLLKTAKGRGSNKYLKIVELLAVEAVIGELVSFSEFPVSRENTGKFCRLRLLMAIQPSH
jgi:hypothetical protein